MRTVAVLINGEIFGANGMRLNDARPGETRAIAPTPVRETKPMPTIADRASGMPFRDRVWLLISSIIEHEGDAFDAVSGLARLIVQLGEHFGTINKFRIAEILRSAADKIEHNPATPLLIERA